MNAPVPPGQSQAVVDDQESAEARMARIRAQMAKNATALNKQIKEAKTASEAEDALADARRMHNATELQGDDFARLQSQAEVRVLDLRVTEGLATAATPAEVRQLLVLIDETEGLTAEAASRKRALRRQVLTASGEMELDETVTIGNLKRFIGSLEEEYRLPDEADTKELRDRLNALAEARLGATRKARRVCILFSLALLAAVPLLVMDTQAPVRWMDSVPNVRWFAYISNIVSALRYSITHHPFMTAAAPVFIAAVVLCNREKRGIAWTRALSRNGLAKLFAIVAWLWLFSVILTHP